MTVDLEGKKVIVMGLGLVGGGVGIVKWLVKRKAKVLVTDLRTRSQLRPSLKKLEGLPVKYVFGCHREADFENADLVIKNPAVPRDSKYLKIAARYSIPVETDISLFFQQCPHQNFPSENLSGQACPIVGITGTKGKSTVTTLVGEIFKKAGYKTFVAGNIGKSPLEFLPIVTSQLSIIILELSSWQLEDLAKIKVSPRVALITNIYPDHLNRYSSMKDYIQAKAAIFKYQGPDDIAVLNYDNPITRRLARVIPGKCFYFSQARLVRGIFIKGKDIIFSPPKAYTFRRTRHNTKFWAGEKEVEHKICSTKDIKIPGRHNLENILAAVSITCLLGVKSKVTREAIRNFKGVAGRLELVRQVRGVKYYNDTTATTPEAVIAALKSLKDKIILIAGGSDKGLKFGKLAKEIKEKCKALILLKGTATPKLKYQIQNDIIQIEEVGSMKDAVRKAEEIAQKGDIVLLSPACASFGMFLNEFDRGKQFIRQVKNL